MGHQEDQVVQKTEGLGILHGDHLPDQLQELLGSGHLGGVESAVDPDHRLPLPGELPGLRLGEPLRQGHPAGDILVAVQVPMVLRAGDDGHHMGTPLGGGSDGVQHHPVRLPGEGLPVPVEGGVVHQLVVRPHLVPEEFLG